MISRCGAFGLMVALVIAAGDAGAQRERGTGTRDACTATLPDSVLTRVPVYFEARPLDSSGNALLPVIDVLVRVVGFHIRRELGGNASSIAAGEPRLSWRDARAGVEVWAHRNRDMVWRAHRIDAVGEETGREVISRALQAVKDSGDGVWLSDDWRVDSLGFVLEFRAPQVDARRRITPVVTRAAVPVFSIGMPMFEPSRALEPINIQYPERARAAGVEGSLRVRFVIDTSGRADMRTFRDVWPQNVMRMGDLGDYYHRLVSAARRGVATSQFVPAKVGGCPVRQLVELPVTFQFAR